MNSSGMELGELVIFQPVLQAYPTRHPWIITAHILLGKLGMPLETLQQTSCQNTTTTQILSHHPSAPTQLLSTLKIELSNIQNTYNSGGNNCNMCIILLQSNQPTDTHPL